MKIIKVIGLILAGMTLLIVSFFAIESLVNRPRDLGPSLEYVGKDYSSGCFLLFCDSPPSTTYYFATDLSQEELVTYFKNARLVDTRDNPEVKKVELGFQTQYQNELRGFTAEYYDTLQDLPSNLELKASDRIHRVAIPDSGDYKYLEIAQSSL